MNHVLRFWQFQVEKEISRYFQMNPRNGFFYNFDRQLGCTLELQMQGRIQDIHILYIDIYI
jgi:hypothetical protein